jgi:hypothetical protein
MNYDYLSAEEFDLMTDEEYQNWLEQNAAYEEALSAAK